MPQSEIALFALLYTILMGLMSFASAWGGAKWSIRQLKAESEKSQQQINSNAARLMELERRQMITMSDETCSSIRKSCVSSVADALGKIRDEMRIGMERLHDRIDEMSDKMNEKLESNRTYIRDQIATKVSANNDWIEEHKHLDHSSLNMARRKNDHAIE